MSQAENLLNNLGDGGSMVYTANPDAEPHIIIGMNRVITIPDELKRLGVQGDHNIETVTFDCPRYWDNNDMSKMVVVINYVRIDGYSDNYPADNVRVDENDDNLMHFDWTISRNVTDVSGPLEFNVCVTNADYDGYPIQHWSSEVCTSTYISKGLECNASDAPDLEPDMVTALLGRMNVLEDGLDDAGITDLGTFAFVFDPDTGETVIDQTVEYNEAMDNARETGIYKIAFTEQGVVDTSIIIAIGCKDNHGEDYVLQLKFTPSMFHEIIGTLPSAPNWYGIAYTRAYYYDVRTSTHQWTGWMEPFERSSYKSTEIDETDVFDGWHYPTSGAVVNYVKSQLRPEPLTSLNGSLEANKEYHLGIVEDLTLSFPTNANPGDVIYVEFYSPSVAPTNLIIDMSNTFYTEIIPEASTLYEIFAKFVDGAWLINYSEHEMSFDLELQEVL